MNPHYGWGVAVVVAPLACTLVAHTAHLLAHTIRTWRNH